MKRLLIAASIAVVTFTVLEATRGFGLFTRSLFRVGKGLGGGHGPHIPLHRHLLFLAAAVVLAIALLALARYLRRYMARLSSRRSGRRASTRPPSSL